METRLRDICSNSVTNLNDRKLTCRNARCQNSSLQQAATPMQRLGELPAGGALVVLFGNEDSNMATSMRLRYLMNSSRLARLSVSAVSQQSRHVHLTKAAQLRHAYGGMLRAC